jgi:ribonuclease Z
MPMKIVFLGVGEACDERKPNTSAWIQTTVDNQRRSLLLDCGFTVPPLYWRQCSDPDDLDAVWISHFHGDHFFGVPALLLRCWEQKRIKPLVIIGQLGIQEVIVRAMELAYPGFFQKLTYPVEFRVAEPGQTVSEAGLIWQFGTSGHSQKNLAVRISDGLHAVFYSGDGRPTPETQELAKECDLIIHEAFHLDTDLPGHGTVRKCIAFARTAGAPLLALVHLQRDERRQRLGEILKTAEAVKDFHVIVPESDEELEL